MEEMKTVNSIEVAKMIGKKHAHLLRDIRGYIDEMNSQNGENPTLDCQDFFIESTYQGTRRKEKCFELTKQGCEFVQNKLTGEKGTKFTALYVEKFNSMEDEIKDTKDSIRNSETKEEIEENINNKRFSTGRIIKTFGSCSKMDLEAITNEFIEYVMFKPTTERISKCRSAIKGVERYIEVLSSDAITCTKNVGYILIANSCKERLIEVEHMTENRRNGGIKASQTKTIKELESKLN